MTKGEREGRRKKRKGGKEERKEKRRDEERSEERKKERKKDRCLGPSFETESLDQAVLVLGLGKELMAKGMAISECWQKGSHGKSRSWIQGWVCSPSSSFLGEPFPQEQPEPLLRGGPMS